MARQLKSIWYSWLRGSKITKTPAKFVLEEAPAGPNVTVKWDERNFDDTHLFKLLQRAGKYEAVVDATFNADAGAWNVSMTFIPARVHAEFVDAEGQSVDI